MKQSIADGFTPVSFAPAASLTLDGSTITEIDTSPSGLLYAACTTAQSGLRAGVFVYLRDEVESDSEYSIACVFAEEGATIASSSNFQWSQGDGDVGDGFGIVVPYGGELIAASLSVQSNASGTCTVEVYKGADADGTSSATGVSVSLSSGEQHNYADYSKLARHRERGRLDHIQNDSERGRDESRAGVSRRGSRYQDCKQEANHGDKVSGKGRYGLRRSRMGRRCNGGD